MLISLEFQSSTSTSLFFTPPDSLASPMFLDSQPMTPSQSNLLPLKWYVILIRVPRFLSILEARRPRLLSFAIRKSLCFKPFVLLLRYHSMSEPTLKRLLVFHRKNVWVRAIWRRRSSSTRDSSLTVRHGILFVHLCRRDLPDLAPHFGRHFNGRLRSIDFPNFSYLSFLISCCCTPGDAHLRCAGHSSVGFSRCFAFVFSRSAGLPLVPTFNF